MISFPFYFMTMDLKLNALLNRRLMNGFPKKQIKQFGEKLKDHYDFDERLEADCSLYRLYTGITDLLVIKSYIAKTLFLHFSTKAAGSSGSMSAPWERIQ